MRVGLKYRNAPTVVAGERYDSKAEARYAQHLELLKKVGAIVEWKRGQRMTLIDGPTPSERVTYRPDFMVTVLYEDGMSRAFRGLFADWKPLTSPRLEAHDVKGMVTRENRIKALLWRMRYPHIPLRFVDENGRERDIFKRNPHPRRVLGKGA